MFTLRWYEDPELRRLITAELNKGEARNTLARAVAFHRLGRFRDRELKAKQRMVFEMIDSIIFKAEMEAQHAA